MVQNKEILLQGQSSRSATDVPASDVEAVPAGQILNQHINVPTPHTEYAPGQSSNSQNAPASSSQAVPGQSSGSQIDAPARNLAMIVPWQSSGNQITDLAFNSEAVLSLPGSSSLQPIEEHPEPTNDTNMDSYDTDYSTDSSSDESVDSEEPEEVKEWRRKYAYYSEELRKIDGGQTEERPESSRNRGVDEATMEMSPQTKLAYHHNNIKSYLRKATDEANMQGYVYGIVLEDDRVLTGSSETLRAWWDNTIKFEQVGPPAANKYYAENQLNIDEPADSEEPPQRTYDLLMKLSDATMGALLSALMSKCEPPQRRFPFENMVRPPWWPTGEESWWNETGAEREPGQPQYRKPHDLKKKWKAVIVISIMKHMAPNFAGMLKIVQSSKHLQDRLSVKEMNAWNSALKEEMKIYSRGHPDVPLSDLLKAFRTHHAPPPGQSSSSARHEAIGHLQQQQIPPPQQQMQQQQQQQVFPMTNVPGGYGMLWGPEMQQQQQVFPMTNQPGGYGMSSGRQIEMFPRSQKRRPLRFTCKNQGCLNHDIEYGFPTAALRDDHQIHCGFQNSMNQNVVPGELPMYAPMVPPFGSTSQVTVPPQHMVTPHPPQQMAPHPPQHMVTPPHPQQQMAHHPPQHRVAPPHPPQQMAPHPPQHMVTPPHPPQQMVPHPPQHMVIPPHPFQSMHQPHHMIQPPFQPMNSPQQMVHPPYQPMNSPQQMVQPPLHEMYGTNTEMMRPPQSWESFNAGISNYPSMPSGSPDISQLDMAFNFGGFYNAPGSSSGGGNIIGPYTQLLNDMNSDAMLMPQENFQYGGGEGSTIGEFEQTSFQQIEPTEMQLFPTHPTLETGHDAMQTNIAMQEQTQFGQIGPLDGSLVTLSQPSMEVPSITIPQESYMQQTGPHVMQNQPSPAEFNQFGTDNSEL